MPMLNYPHKNAYEPSQNSPSDLMTIQTNSMSIVRRTTLKMSKKMTMEKEMKKGRSLIASRTTIKRLKQHCSSLQLNSVKY